MTTGFTPKSVELHNIIIAAVFTKIKHFTIVNVATTVEAHHPVLFLGFALGTACTPQGCTGSPTSRNRNKPDNVVGWLVGKLKS